MRRIPHPVVGSALTMFLGAAFVLAAVAVLAPAAPARADGSAPVGPSQVDKCIGTAPLGVDRPPTCVYDANGNLVSRSDGTTAGPSGDSAVFVGILLVAFVWSLLPMVIAASIARSRGEPIATALLLALLLGWIGLAIVAYGRRRVSTDVAGLVGKGAPAPPATADRLRVIDELHAQGLITDEERARRRTAIVDAL